LFAHGRSESELSFLTNKPSVAAVRSAIGAVVPPEPVPKNPPDALLRGNINFSIFDPLLIFILLGTTLAPPLAWGLLASLWGGLQWRRAGIAGGLSFSDARKFAAKQNKTGRYIFFLLMLDPIAQIVMGWPEKGIKLPLIEEPVKVLGWYIVYITFLRCLSLRLDTLF
jgi:hypothetical protein